MAGDVVCLTVEGGRAEALAGTTELLNAVAKLSFVQHPIAAVDPDDQTAGLSREVLEACRSADAILLEPIWPTEGGPPPSKRAAFALREALSLAVAVRPLKVRDPSASPMKPDKVRGLDLLLVNDLGSATPAEGWETADEAGDRFKYSEDRIIQAARVAFGSARKRVACLRIMSPPDRYELHAFWRSVLDKVRAEEFSDLEIEYLDKEEGRLVPCPGDFDVALTLEMRADLLWHEGVAMLGGVGLFPRASLGADGPGLFESPPSPRGSKRGHADPLAMFLSAAMMLRHGLHLESEAAAVELAVERALDAGLRTPDLGGTAGTAQATRAVLDHL